MNWEKFIMWGSFFSGRKALLRAMRINSLCPPVLLFMKLAQIRVSILVSGYLSKGLDATGSDFETITLAIHSGDRQLDINLNSYQLRLPPSQRWATRGLSLPGAACGVRSEIPHIFFGALATKCLCLFSRPGWGIIFVHMESVSWNVNE